MAGLRARLPVNGILLSYIETEGGGRGGSGGMNDVRGRERYQGCNCVGPVFFTSLMSVCVGHRDLASR